MLTDIYFHDRWKSTKVVRTKQNSLYHDYIYDTTIVTLSIIDYVDTHAVICLNSNNMRCFKMLLKKMAFSSEEG